MRRHLSRLTTQESVGGRLGQAMTGIHIRKRHTKEGGEGNVFIVGYHDEHDPTNPHNWSYLNRIGITSMIASIGFVVGVASSIDSMALTQAAEEFGVSEVVESLATGLYLVGFGCGALFAGPISETVGRNPVYIVTLTLYMIFIMASALAPNIGAQLAFRFLAGFFGSTPLTCAGGSISDIWDPFERVYAFPVFANAAFLGPVLGPVMGGYIAQGSSQLPAPQWRWVEWITLIISGLVLTLVILFAPETFSPILLKWKASHLRDIAGDDRYRAEVEVRQEHFLTRLRRALYRPFLLTATEPIILLIALYLTVIYIVLFTFLDGFTYIFQDIHGTSQGVTGLCFVGIAVGLFGATALVPLVGHQAKVNLRAVQEQGGTHLPPEFRLRFAMYGSPAIPISILWMGWTSYEDISIRSPLAASAFFGFGILCVFISSYQYIIDSYEIYAASALASVTLIRYVVAGGMTVVGISFYHNLGVHYTLTILGCISCICVPVPYVFHKYGRAIRQRSRCAPLD
ncbi:major facilitator superfamily domain-containing protein [Elsinoe ampelina]|uniref:Major facilitator superfamily domain-containing protein n=1 Tax=Elsinoe ampelina TaxID=302913 RepID=A0A6A6FXU5_9PEZI|nr:major facilitator superfamily domain-containing protein [Elsinoe ampelina]